MFRQRFYVIDFVESYYDRDYYIRMSDTDWINQYVLHITTFCVNLYDALFYHAVWLRLYEGERGYIRKVPIQWPILRFFIAAIILFNYKYFVTSNVHHIALSPHDPSCNEVCLQ